MGHRRHTVLDEELGEEPHHHLAVLQHVGDTAGHAQVVFEHVVLAAAVRVAGAHDVNARDVAVDAAGYIDAHHLGRNWALFRIWSAGTMPALRIS